MNEEIEKILENFEVPFSFKRYGGSAETYITYQETHHDPVLNGDNKIMYLIYHYDFDIYSKTDYTNVIEHLKILLLQNGWTWEPDSDSEDMYEDDTGYFHKTICFAKEKYVEVEEI